MKKIITIISTLFLFVANVNAATTNVGIKGSYGNFNAAGSHTTNSDGSNTGGTAVNSSGDANFPYGSLMIEREGNFSGFNVAIGLDYVPFKAEVETLGGGTGTDAKVNLKDYYTIYVQPTKTFGNGVGVFAKLGYSEGKLTVTDVKRQASFTTGAATTVSTDSGAKLTLKGFTYGVGVEKTFSNSAFVRLEYNYTDYDNLTYTTSNSKVLKADSDLSTGSITIGKKF